MWKRKRNKEKPQVAKQRHVLATEEGRATWEEKKGKEQLVSLTWG